MSFDGILATAMDLARRLGLLSSWQVWALFLLLVVAQIWWHSIGYKLVQEPDWDPEKGTGNLSPPIPLDQEQWVQLPDGTMGPRPKP